MSLGEVTRVGVLGDESLLHVGVMMSIVRETL